MKSEKNIQEKRQKKPRLDGTRKHRRFWNRSRQERVFTMPYMLLSIIGVLTFYILPFAVVIFYALIDNTTNANFVGIDNFVKLFGNTNWFKSFWKNRLNRIVSNLKNKGFEDKPYTDKNC